LTSTISLLLACARDDVAIPVDKLSRIAAVVPNMLVGPPQAAGALFRYGTGGDSQAIAGTQNEANGDEVHVKASVLPAIASARLRLTRALLARFRRGLTPT
jgi:hypothetical protein